MPIVHFLNVGQGDCSIIEHRDDEDRASMIDVCNARKNVDDEEDARKMASADVAAKASPNTQGNYGQKNYPTNPIAYMQKLGVTEIWRFISTHPEMDHLDGLADVIDQHRVLNFWSIGDNKPNPGGWGAGKYREIDWMTYERLRDGGHPAKRIVNRDKSNGSLWNRNLDNTPGGHGLHALAPIDEFVRNADQSGDYNDASYVLVLVTPAGRVLFCGDAHDETLAHVCAKYGKWLRGVEVMIAPHHGRDSKRDYAFLDVIKPRLTLFGIAKSEHLGYAAWKSRGLKVRTNNQCRDIILDCTGPNLDLYCTNQKFAADSVAGDPLFRSDLGGYLFGCLKKHTISEADA